MQYKVAELYAYMKTIKIKLPDIVEDRALTDYLLS